MTVRMIPTHRLAPRDVVVQDLPDLTERRITVEHVQWDHPVSYHGRTLLCTRVTGYETGNPACKVAFLGTDDNVWTVSGNRALPWSTPAS